ncbi:MAG: pre-peptidase C-terminal domain-containing protein, partial [Anaerolinea sp.]|nr:pre-peptidase C-terminal domain-containing protein [Anaerolinea sp.]
LAFSLFTLLILIAVSACGTPTPPLPTLAMLPSPVPSSTLTPSLTPSPTLTETPVPTFTRTPPPTETDTPTLTPSPTATYTPSLTPTPTFTPTEVYAALGALVGTLVDTSEAEFISGFERHVYTFEGRAGEWVTLTMSSTDPAVDPVVMLVNPDGLPLALDDDSGENGAALLRGVRLVTTGRQIVVASGGGYGRYTIRLTRSDAPPSVTPIPPQPTPMLPAGSVTPAPHTEYLRDHTPISAVLEARGFDRYFIDAEAGAFITLGASALAPSANLRLEVYNPAGEVMISLNARESAASGDALIPALGVIETGMYTVIVTDDARIGGAYTISYGLGGSHSDILRGGITPDSPVRGEVWQRGWRDVWSVWLNQGDRGAVDLLVDNGQFGAALAVIAPDGTPIGTTTTADAPLTDLSAPVSGWYAIRVDGAFARTYGSYSLTWRMVSAAPTATPLPGTIPILTAETTLPANSVSGLLYPFQGRAGDRIRIRVIGLAGVDPVAELQQFPGEVIASSDDADGLNPVIEVTLTADGTYAVLVNDYGDTGGAIRLTVERLV